MKLTGEIFDKVKKRLTPQGREKLDPTPMAPPVGYKKTPSLSEQIRAMVVSERLAQEAINAGYETFEEADDFDIPDDPTDPSTPYENDFDPPVAELKRREQQETAARQAKEQEQPSPAPAPKPSADPAEEKT